MKRFSVVSPGGVGVNRVGFTYSTGENRFTPLLVTLSLVAITMLSSLTEILA